MWIINAIKFDTSAIDEQAWTIFITGLLVVFIALWAIAVILKQFQNFLNRKERKALKAKLKEEKAELKQPAPIAMDADEDTKAAIALAIHLYFNQQHDDESLILTISTIDRLSSPWAAKTFNALNK